MIKSKYLILNSFYFKFDTKLSKIISVNKSFNEQNILDLERFNDMNFIRKDIFENLNLNFVFLPISIEAIDISSFFQNNIQALDLSNCINLNIIMGWAFGKNQIKQLKLPKNIEMMSMEAFGKNQIKLLDLSNCINLKVIYDNTFAGNPLKEIKILNNINVEFTNNLKNFNDLWYDFAKYYNKNKKKAGNYKLENNEWKWYPL